VSSRPGVGDGERVGPGIRAARWFQAHPRATLATSLTLELITILPFRWADLDAWRGLPGAVGILFGVLAALLCGPAVGGTVALFGAILLATLGSGTAPVLVGIPLVGVWVGTAVLAGAIASGERRRTADAIEGARTAAKAAGRAQDLAERTAGRMRRLQSVTAELSRVATAGQVASVAARRAADLVGASGAALYVAAPGSDELELRSTGVVEDSVPWAPPSLGVGAEHPASEAFRRRSVVVVGRGEAWTSAVAALVRGARGPLGSLLVVFDAQHQVTDEERTLLESVGDLAGRALERAERYEAERATAEILQRSLLPSVLPRIPRLRAAGRYEAGGPDVQVGGDWYDLLELPNGTVGLVVGDVVGRGIPAATIMAKLRSGLRAYATEREGPGEVVAALGRHLELYESGGMATLLYLVVDPRTGFVRYASAGHPPPVLRQPDGATQLLDGGRSTPLGATPEPVYPEGRARLPEGGSLVLYTDGLVERRSESLDAGLTRLRAAVAEGPPVPEGMCRHLLDAVRQPVTEDDVALLVVERVPLPASFRESLPARPEELAGLRRRLADWLTRLDAGEQEAFDIVLAASEASSNTIVHAYGATDQAFDVHAEVQGRDVVIEVVDRGRWRHPRDGAAGRGIELMRALMDDVQITTTERGTSVRMRRRLGSTL
jgi:serine phosphatase RsbU (regulator of sigma subunit)/anti-sigma regulatory factor (Ser/Thr protein kinase)